MPKISINTTLHGSTSAGSAFSSGKANKRNEGIVNGYALKFGGILRSLSSFNNSVIFAAFVMWSSLLTFSDHSSMPQLIGVFIALFSIIIFGQYGGGIPEVFWIYCGFCFFGVLASVIDGVVTDKLFAYLLVLIFSGVYLGQSRQSRQRIFHYLCFAGMLSVVFGLIVLDKSILFDSSEFHRMDSLGINPNAWAYISVMSFLGFASCENWRSMKVLSFVLCFVLVWATKSKTGMILLFIGAAVHLYYIVPNRQISRWLASLFMIGILASLFFYKNVIFDIYQINDQRSLSTGTGRTEAWDYIGVKFLEGNFTQILIGRGIGSATDDVKGILSNSHNAWLTVLYDTGFLGLILIVAMIWLSIHLRPGGTHLAIITAGCLEALTEVNFIGIGNVGSIILILAILDRNVGLQYEPEIVAGIQLVTK